MLGKIKKGGTAGCVLASRLSEDPANNVLLLEAGTSDGNLLYAKIPMFYPQLHKDLRYDWGFETVKQTHAHDRELIWPRGKMLGGCSNVNAMIVSGRTVRISAQQALTRSYSFNNVLLQTSTRGVLKDGFSRTFCLILRRQRHSTRFQICLTMRSCTVCLCEMSFADARMLNL